MTDSTALLELRGIHAACERIEVLRGVDLSVMPGTVFALLGPNGAGKTTTLNVASGQMAPTAGSVYLSGFRVNGVSPDRLARLGVCTIPEGRGIFPNLTVRENLVATAGNRCGNANPWTLERVYELFPSLANRANNMGNQLSGGEQQMLAIGRALMTNPRLLILDEATEGLAPLIRAEIWRCVSNLKKMGQSILIIDKNLAALCSIADRHYVMEKGKVIWTGTSDALRADEAVQHKYLGV
jgi:branched-chain amino acid transport system ATP-binding protein